MHAFVCCECDSLTRVGVVHTTTSRVYKLSVPMVASNIVFAGFEYGQLPSFKARIAFFVRSRGLDNVVCVQVLDKVKVSIQPANIPDLRTLYLYDYNKDAKVRRIARIACSLLRVRMVSQARRFQMTVATVGGRELTTVAGSVGKAEDGKMKCTFSLDVPNTLDAIGDNMISFQYIDANGNVSFV